jgi:hypothetical protein
MGGEYKRRFGIVWRRGEDVDAITFDGHAFNVVAERFQLGSEIQPDGGFVAGYGFDVDELACEANGIEGHARKE